MARRRRKPSASDLAEISSGRASSRDRAEAGMRSKTRGHGRKHRVLRKRGRRSNR